MLYGLYYMSVVVCFSILGLHITVNLNLKRKDIVMLFLRSCDYWRLFLM